MAVSPVEHFAKLQQYHNLVLSPDGKHYATIFTNENGKFALAILNRKRNEVTTTLSWRGKEMPLSVSWLNNERVGVRVGLKSNLLEVPLASGEYIAMNLDGSKKTILHGARKKAKRNQARSSAEKGRISVVNYLRDEPKFIEVMKTSPVGYAEHKRVNIYSGKEKLISKSPVKGGGMVLDNDGQARFAVGLDAESGKNLTEVYYRDSAKDDWKVLDSYDEDEGSIQPISFAPDNKNVYVLSTLTSDKKGLYLYDVKSKSLKPVAVNDRVDLMDANFDRDGNVVAVSFEPDYSSVEVIDKTHPIGKWYPALIKSFRGAKVSLVSATQDYSEIVVLVESDKDPGSFYIFNTKTSKLELAMKAKPWLSAENFGTTEAFSFKARDGMEIFGYLTLPKGKQENLPMILIPHGGPHGPRDYWTYDDDVQFLAERGYAVMKVNFRGSGGYGKEHMKKGYRQWGGNIMNDLTDGVNWAVKNGIADKDRLCIYGASFGGYSALMSVVKEPDLYKCAIGYVGIYDMDLMFEKGDVPGSLFGVNFLNKVLGKDAEELDRYSPARYVDKIKADIFIVHGEEDIRAHYDHALLLKDKLDEKNMKYEWMSKAKEGHGFYNEDNRKELYERMAAFFEKNIGS